MHNCLYDYILLKFKMKQLSKLHEICSLCTIKECNKCRIYKKKHSLENTIRKILIENE